MLAVGQHVISFCVYVSHHTKQTVSVKYSTLLTLTSESVSSFDFCSRLCGSAHQRARPTAGGFESPLPLSSFNSAGILGEEKSSAP